MENKANPSFAKIEQEIATMLDVADDELTEEQKQEMDKYLQELGEAESAKVDRFAGFIKEQSARAKAIKEESRRLAGRAKAIENRIASLKEYYQFSMLQHGVQKINGDVYTVSVRKNKAVQIEDECINILPEAYLKRTVEPVKTEIKKALEQGINLLGCKLVETTSINIR